ncbi:MAG: hypothetical protein COA99_18430 [Moraxellaceae bacterium]|nr:MAG: hypothetical protein COA99_18430 [Moraxellaceae bacterium]
MGVEDWQGWRQTLSVRVFNRPFTLILSGLVGFYRARGYYCTNATSATNATNATNTTRTHENDWIFA